MFGSRGKFFARGFDISLDTTREIMVAAARHKGTAVVEVLQNCVIFNHGIHTWLSDKEVRAERTITLHHGEKMLFGKNNEKGLVRDGFNIKAVVIGEDGYTIDDVLVHDAHAVDDILHRQLALMDGHDLPLALGVIRDVEAPTYEHDVEAQVEEVKAKKGFTSLKDMVLKTCETWTV